MTIKFIPARELEKHYDVWGHFYSIEVPGEIPARCRSVLEIKAKNLPTNDAPDAIFVMMNPGCSKPLVESEDLNDVDRTAAMNKVLVPAQPDTTQYQVMRVMIELGWTHVRVLNLSDLHDTKSKAFEKLFVRVEQASGNSVHSIFAKERSEELSAQLKRKPNAPVVCAWGVSKNLNTLIEEAVKALPSDGDLVGLAKPGPPGKYFHPLPTPQARKEEWVAQMLVTLRRKQLTAASIAAAS